MSTKYKQIKVNLNPDFYQKILKYAEINEMSIAEVFRQCVGTKIEDSREAKIRRVHKSTDPKLLYQLNRIGNNLNQVAKYLNSGQVLDNQVLIQLVQIEENIKRFL